MGATILSTISAMETHDDKVGALYCKINCEKCMSDNNPEDVKQFDAILRTFEAYVAKRNAPYQAHDNEKREYSVVVHANVLEGSYLMVQMAIRMRKMCGNIEREEEEDLLFSKREIGNYLRNVSYITHVFDSMQAYEQDLLNS